MRRFVIVIAAIAMFTVASNVATNLAAEELKGQLKAGLGENYRLIIVGGAFVLAVLVAVVTWQFSQRQTHNQSDGNLEEKFKNIWLGPDGISTYLKADLQASHGSIDAVRAELDSYPPGLPFFSISVHRTYYQFTADDWRMVKQYDKDLARFAREFMESLVNLNHCVSVYSAHRNFESKNILHDGEQMRQAYRRVEQATPRLLNKLEYYDRVLRGKSA